MILPRLRLALYTSALLLSPQAHAENTYGLGVEGFYDHYREPDLAVTTKSGYGSLTAYYAHDWQRAFLALDGRASYGRASYDSPDGSSSGTPQYEFETRLRAGMKFALGGGVLTPYLGLGARYFIDQGKDTSTSLGYYGYDRRIFQTYAPIGVGYSYTTANNWTLSPTIEYDPLLWGNVNSRLQNGGGYNINNRQHDGYGLRGEFMIGRQERGFSWQVGPFVRYWKIEDSATTSAPDGDYIEPKNERWQIGLAARALW